MIGIVKIPSAAEEITQNAFVKAMTAEHGYQEASTEFTWICAIAKNLCNDFFKENSRKAELSEAENYVSSIGNGEDTLFQKETSLEIHKILHSLDEPYKVIMMSKKSANLYVRIEPDVKEQMVCHLM